jgi:pimeloyl-ACP methyl ester carboxylesterase
VAKLSHGALTCINDLLVAIQDVGHGRAVCAALSPDGPHDLFQIVGPAVTGLLLLILAGLIGLVGILVAWSPGRPAPLVDATGQPIEGSLSEKVFVEINGIRQGMFIQSTALSNPVLLFVHGGPGMPLYFLNATHPAGLEQDFTIVWWEQRGAGMSYCNGIPVETMTLAQFIADAIAVTHYLRKRFAKEKIYLLGHSWGSFLGIQVAAAAPELFHAYIGMGQVSHQLKSEVMAHRYMLDQYNARGDVSMVRRLAAAPVSVRDGLSDAYMGLRDVAMHRLGVGTTRDMGSVITGVFFPVWRCRAYTLREKMNFWRGPTYSRPFLWEEVLKTDLATRVERLDLPVYFFIGLHDYTTNRDLARDLFAQISAPLKGFYTFKDSAHSPLFEEPQRARQILLQDVLNQRVGLSDGEQQRLVDVSRENLTRINDPLATKQEVEFRCAPKELT